jgi:glycosyltransferase involved in cell wall biosynthesis
MTKRPTLVHVFVANWNNDRFIGEAVASAVDQTHPHVDVYVVDDGSTDDSRAVIAAFAAHPRVHVVHKTNGGQASAFNTAWRLVRERRPEPAPGELVILLDGDDFLLPDCAARVAAAAARRGADGDGFAKIQFRQCLVDADGVRFGVDPPAHTALSCGDVADEVLRTGTYRHSVNGNAYARHFVDAVFPVPEDDFRNISDGYLNPLAPLHGRIVCVDEELSAYRQHDRNRWAFGDTVAVATLREKYRHDLTVQRYLDEAAAERGRTMTPHARERTPLHVMHRLAALRLDPAGHEPGDTRAGLFVAGIRAVRRADLPVADALYLAACIAVIAVTPRVFAPDVVNRVLRSRPRPAWMRHVGAVARRLLR